MAWNWEQPDWPRFTWDPARLARAEEAFLRGAGAFIGASEHLDAQSAALLKVEAMSSEALTTSRLEGVILDRESVQSSIRAQLGLDPRPRARAKPAERGIAEMMVDLYRRFASRLDEGVLCQWHAMVMRGRRDLRDVGRYRTHADAMQVVSGPLHRPVVHFEAPPSKRVPAEMARFVEWFDRTGPEGPEPLPAVTRAGMAHLFFESIHPFEDGNGRVGRAVSELALAQGTGQPALTALATTILSKQRSYYDALAAANRGLEIGDWLAWFAGTTLEAQRRTLGLVQFLVDKARFLERWRDQLSERQKVVILRVLREGPTGFEGGLSAGKYVAIAKTSTATATRDLGELVEKGALRKTGELRHTRYHVTIPLRSVPRIEVDSSGAIVEREIRS